MSIHHNTYLVILFIAMTISVLALQCPTTKECHCELNKLKNLNNLWTADINCTMDNNSVFNIFIDEYSYTYIKITCINSSELSDFNLIDVWNLTRTGNYGIMFKECNLSKNIKLIDIVRMIGATNVDQLSFESYKKLNLTLEKRHLNGFEKLGGLIIKHNIIFHMDKDLLRDLKELRVLSLTNNILEHLPAEFFNNSHKLELLIYMDNNNLRRIEPNTFAELKNLKYLFLNNNSLTELPSGIFDKLVALDNLDVSTNNLSSLSEDIFSKLENLTFLFLDSNNFIKLPRDLLRNNNKLEAVYLSDNQRNLTLFDGFFSSLKKLLFLTLMNNGLVTLPEDVFWGLSSLYSLALNNNYLESLPKKIFRDLRKLRRLYLNSNNLDDLPDYIFINTNQLRELDLSNNRITFISKEKFDGLYLLEELNMKQNHLRTVSYDSFSSLIYLKIINLSDNNLTLQSHWSYINSPFFNCSRLKELYLANNSIAKIFNDWIINHDQLHKLDLSYNNISSIKTEDLLFKSNDIIVNLSHNTLQHIFLHDANYIIKEKTKTDRFVQILVDNNPLNCNCDMYDFLRYNEGKMRDVQSYFQIKLENLTCHSPKELEKERIYSTNLTCRIKNTDSVTLCPEKCDCFLKPHDKAFIFDCSNKNLTTVPNDIKEPNILFIQNLTRSIDTILQFFFNLSHNQLTIMPDLKKLGLKSVNEFFLSYNNISTISLNGLSTTLKVLELENNNLSAIHPNVLKFWKNSKNLTHLTLHKNPWECDCDATELLNFTRTSYEILPELSKMMCHRQKKSILVMTFNDFCPFDATVIIITSVIIAFIGLIIGILGLYYKYQTHIKIWLFARQWCLWSVTEEELNEDRGTEYDAFVSFSHKDHDFIANELVRKLESGATPFKLCLHYRDWLDSETLTANILRSVENSRRTMVVLSKNFLDSNWGRLEFKIAHGQPLSEGRSRVILILYGDIGPTDNLDPELRAYISMNTYIQWGDPRFWDRLRYAIRRQSRRPICIPVRRKVYCTLL